MCGSGCCRITTGGARSRRAANKSSEAGPSLTRKFCFDFCTFLLIFTVFFLILFLFSSFSLFKLISFSSFFLLYLYFPLILLWPTSDSLLTFYSTVWMAVLITLSLWARSRRIPPTAQPATSVSDVPGPEKRRERREQERVLRRTLLISSLIAHNPASRASAKVSIQIVASMRFYIEPCRNWVIRALLCWPPRARPTHSFEDRFERTASMNTSLHKGSMQGWALSEPIHR